MLSVDNDLVEALDGVDILDAVLNVDNDLEELDELLVEAVLNVDAD